MTHRIPNRMFELHGITARALLGITSEANRASHLITDELGRLTASLADQGLEQDDIDQALLLAAADCVTVGGHYPDRLDGWLFVVAYIHALAGIGA